MGGSACERFDTCSPAGWRACTQPARACDSMRLLLTFHPPRPWQWRHSRPSGRRQLAAQAHLMPLAQLVLLQLRGAGELLAAERAGGPLHGSGSASELLATQAVLPNELDAPRARTCSSGLAAGRHLGAGGGACGPSLCARLFCECFFPCTESAEARVSTARCTGANAQRAARLQVLCQLRVAGEQQLAQGAARPRGTLRRPRALLRH